jgi:hypothetical protein
MTTQLRGAVRRGPLIAVAVIGLVLVWAASRTCLSTGFAHGLWLNECPDGELRQTVHVSSGSLIRGGVGSITVNVQAVYTTGPADTQASAPLSRFTPSLTLIGPSGAQPLTPQDGWKDSGSSKWATISLPLVQDGEYLLRATVKSTIGETSVDAALPLYAPARVHVLTDRPLFEPGNTVQFRALALNAGTLAPLNGRPGIWRVTDPNGEVLLEEKAPAGEWGVVSGSFPLDSQAQSGTWWVSWTSGSASQSRSFTVKPFTLPRFRVETSTSKPYYRRGERPQLRGEVRYSSGAPVAKAKLAFTWNTSGTWPPPTSWLNGSALPQQAETNTSGSFSLDLPAVPEDLQGEAHLLASISAVDPSGDRVESAADILLAEDAINVTAVSELRDGLVEGFNNRLYLRATTADGQVISHAELLVKRLWEPTDKGVVSKTDEDGVAGIQIDPGPAVNVVIPALPFRPPPSADPVTRSDLQDHLAEDEVSLADRLSFDRAEEALARCTRYVGNEGGSVMLGIHVRSSGEVEGIAGTASRLSQCVKRVIQGVRFSPGDERLFGVSFQFNDEDLPRLDQTTEGVPRTPPWVDQAFSDAMLDVRDCLPSTIQSGPLQARVFWHDVPGAKELNLTWTNEKNGGRVPESALSCIRSRLSKLSVSRPAGPSDKTTTDPNDVETVGFATFEVQAPEKYEVERPQETIMEGYEFSVTAKSGGETLGSTKLRLRPGQIPDVRLRASRQLLKPGEQFTVQLLRGPNWAGTLPEFLFLRQGGRSWKSKFDEKEKTATFELPTDVEGWFSVQFESAEVFLFSRPKAQLDVTVKAEQEHYAPGQLAHLHIETHVGGVGGAAAVGLFGVDDSLSQLVPLPGSTELDGLRPRVESAFAFPSIDAQALAQGRVRGGNAQAATLLKVSNLPPTPEIDTPVSLSANTVIDPNEVLVDRFYVALSELHVQTREWEASATTNEKMTPRVMAGLWKKSLDALEKRKESSRDIWGRPLRLHRLPRELLALTEPRQVVIDGTRLPEDSENWNLWVAKEKP